MAEVLTNFNTGQAGLGKGAKESSANYEELFYNCTEKFRDGVAYRPTTSAIMILGVNSQNQRRWQCPLWRA
jgi:hypothetical protein